MFYCLGLIQVLLKKLITTSLIINVLSIHKNIIRTMPKHVTDQ